MDSCSFRGKTTDTLVHLFWNCKHTQAFWKKLLDWMSQKIVNLQDVFSPFLCLGLVENLSNVLLHHLLLIARHYIHTCKVKSSITKLQVYTASVNLPQHEKLNLRVRNDGVKNT